MLYKIAIGLTICFITWALLESEGFRDGIKVAELAFICYILYEIYKVLSNG